MKQFTWSLVLAFLAFACQMQDEPTSLSDDASSQGAVTCVSYPDINGAYYTPNNNYTNTATFPDGYTLNLTIDKVAGSKAKSISHLIFKFTDCEDKAIGMDRITGITVNGSAFNSDSVEYFQQLSNTEGTGTDCFSGASAWGTYTVLSQGFDTFPVNISITFSTTLSGGGAAAPVKNGAFLLKAGSFNSPGDDGGCFGAYYSVSGLQQGQGNNCKYTFTYHSDDPAYSFSRDCTPPPTCYQNDSAWGTGDRYVSRGNWATFSAYSSEKPTNIYAGQSKHAGSVTMSPVSAGNEVTLTITLNSGWSLQEVSNPVKIHGYSTSQAGAGNPSPGRFAFKGSSLTVTVPAYAFYGIHLDVRQVVPCP